MQKKTLRWVLIIVVAAITLYQFIYEDENIAPINSEPVAPTLLQSNEEDIATEVAEEPNSEVAEFIDTPTASSVDTFIEEFDLEEPAGDFDFFVMALSWSPDYCASNGDNDPQQCSTGKKLDFVLHGLWPQYNSGYPSYCSTETMSYDLIDDFAGLYPSEKLYNHEWEKHGTCTGLTPEGYLFWSQALKESLIIPDAFDSPSEPFRTDIAGLREAFIQINSEFSEDSFAAYCSGSGRFLKELFVCFEKDGEPTNCSDEILKKASKSCGQENFLVRNTR